MVAAADWSEEVLEIYAANFAHPVLCLDLADVGASVQALRPLGPFDLVQISAPCTDFSQAGKGVEGAAAFVTVTCTRIAIALGAPTIIYENVPRALASAAWREAATLLSSRGFTWTQSLVDARFCGVPQRRVR